MRWFFAKPPIRVPIDRVLLEADRPVLFLALKGLILAGRQLVDERPNDPQLEGLRDALRFYEGYWNGTTWDPDTGTYR